MPATSDAAGAQKAAGKARSFFSKVWAKLREIDLNPETAFQPKRPPPCSRQVYVNHELPEEAYDSRHRIKTSWIFASNQVISAKYTAYNFVFKNLLEQFRRVANLFFLVLVILQFFPEFTTISPGLAMLPLLIVLAITMIKDGYEDIKRHQSDRAMNRQRTHTLAGHGFKNPNHMELKSRSLEFVIRYLKRIFTFRTPKHEQRHGEAQPTQHRQSAVLERGEERVASPQPMSPTADEHHASFAFPDDGRQTSQSHAERPSMQMRRQSTMASRRASTYSKRDHEHWRTRMWEDVHVGDIVKVYNNEEIPADIVICATSEEDHSCYIETKNLDGEINLKSRFAVPELEFMQNPADCTSVPFEIEVEPQTTDMYRFNASVRLLDEQDEDGHPVQCPVTLNQVLLRGCSLRNTDWVIGVVAMTGCDTKIILNSGATPSKRSKMEFQMNKMVWVNLLIIAIIAVVCAIVDSLLEQYYHKRSAYWTFASEQNDDNPHINGLIAFANSLITFQNFVPISLYISLEVVRTIQALFIFEDYDMYYEKNNRRTTAKSWNLSDELGQIEYIISDKTGTLTQNLMIFRECYIGNVVYHGSHKEGQAADDSNRLSSADGTDEKAMMEQRSPETQAEGEEKEPESEDEDGRMHAISTVEGVPPYRDAQLDEAINDPNHEQHEPVRRFMECLALCHTVHTSVLSKTRISYKAESPDEQALVQTAADNGYVFCGTVRNKAQLQVPGQDEQLSFDVLQVIEFSSARKRMSVILRRHSDRKIIMFSKGADAVIFERCADGQDQRKQETDKALEEFANKGLRTLCFAYKELDDQTYNAWAKRYHEATVSTEDREERMEELADEMERGFQLLGSSAIEDKLQDGVPETIADLKRAGIKIWVATGDKLETAIAIGYSTLLLSRDMNLVIVRGGEYGSNNSAYAQLEAAVARFFGGHDALSQMRRKPPPLEEVQVDDQQSPAASRPSNVSHTSLVGEDNGQRPGGFALVIEGSALHSIMEEEFSQELMLRVASCCRVVVCCRVSPLQKALMVRFVRNKLKAITLAIGDGANDVSMIQAAQVGVGVAGEEGLQAVNSSDYAIGQFRFLKRLLLVHGHWSYYRNSKMINLFFYKQVVHTGTLFWFQIYAAWSTSQGMDYVYLLLWNAIWTVAAVVGIGIFDRNLSDHVLMQVPELYWRSREGRYFGVWRFMGYMLDGLYQSVILFFFIMYYYDTTSPRQDGYSISLYESTTTMVIATAFVANLYCGLEALAWTWWIVFAVFIGPVLIFIFAPIYAAFPPSVIWTFSYSNNYRLYRSIQFWFGSIWANVVCMLPRLVYEYFHMLFFPTDAEVVRMIDIKDPNHDYVHDPRMPGIRAAQAYEPEADMDPDTTTFSQAGVDSYPLIPTQSRGSSIHYDMSTGLQSFHRGYSFSAEDKPPRRLQRLRTFGSKLRPSHLLRRATGADRQKRGSKRGHEEPKEREEQDVAPAQAEPHAQEPAQAQAPSEGEGQEVMGEAIGDDAYTTDAYQSPVDAYQSPVDAYQSPTDVYQSPTVYQSPATTYQSPMPETQPPLFTSTPLFSQGRFQSGSTLSTSFQTATDRDARTYQRRVSSYGSTSARRPESQDDE